MTNKKVATVAITTADVLSAIRAFDAAKHAQGKFRELEHDVGRDDGAFHDALLRGVKSLSLAFDDLSKVVESNITGTADDIAKVHAAASKRLQNWRTPWGEWKNAQFATELFNYGRSANLYARDADINEDDIEVWRVCAEGFEKIRAHCEKYDLKWTFQSALDEIHAAIAEAEALPIEED